MRGESGTLVSTAVVENTKRGFEKDSSHARVPVRRRHARPRPRALRARLPARSEFSGVRRAATRRARASGADRSRVAAGVWDGGVHSLVIRMCESAWPEHNEAASPPLRT